MRESNFAFPAQNKACVCINSQLYDRRALDTTSSLPLLNSLQHLQYLTSTSPRIREIMTMDGGLERLVRILYDFCLSPPPPDNPTLVYGLTPPGYRPSKTSPALNPVNYDKHAAFRFSLAFQCVVNIGVRGSEPIRSRVVQAGTLDVVGCVLEAWLASKGFAIGPSSSATGIPRETREQRHARRLAQAEQRQREEAAALARALQRQILFEQMQQRIQHMQERARLQRILADTPNFDEVMDATTPNTRTRTRTTLPVTDGTRHVTASSGNSNNNSDNDEQTNDFPSAPASTSTATPVPAPRDRSGTIVAHHQPTHLNPQVLLNHPQPQAPENMLYRRSTPSPSASTDTSRAETETEDEPEHDADGDIDMDRLPRSRSANRGSSSIASRRHALAEARLQINANLAIQRNQQNQNLTAVYPHNQTLSPGSAASTPASGSASPSPERGPLVAAMRSNPARQVRFGTVQDRAATMPGVGVAMSGGGDTDPHIVIPDTVVGAENMNMAMGVGMGVADMTVGAVEGDIVSLQTNDDFAMGAPPGAPGAIVGMEESAEGATPRGFLGDDEGRRVTSLMDTNSTPRAGVIDLPDAGVALGALQRDTTIRGRSASVGEGSSVPAGISASTSRAAPGTRDDSESGASGSGVRLGLNTDSRGQPAQGRVAATEMTATVSDAATTATTVTNTTSGSTTSTPSMMANNGPYRDEDVLLGLQLLAYLSKYPHVRQAFYKPRTSFHPASLGLHQASAARATGVEPSFPGRERQVGAGSSAAVAISSNQGFLRALAGRGRAALNSAGLGANPLGVAAGASASASHGPPPRQTNVFSLVERFTFRPGSNEADLPNPPPRLPPEIQYWAGVIMRNACRKDESRGGIRQCANMLCGRWEQYPREFAKCRRCRKAKYCGKDCQSTAWSEGHRFWCSAKDGEEEGGERDRRDRETHHRNDETNQPQVAQQQAQGPLNDAPGHNREATATMPGGLTQVSPRAERAARRERERRWRELGNVGNDPMVGGPEAAQRTVGFAIEPAVTFMAGLGPRLHMHTHTHHNHTGHGAPSPIGETQEANPIAGPSHPGGAGVVLTEAAVHQQRVYEHQRILEADWFGHGPPAAHHQPQVGPSRLDWQPPTGRANTEEAITGVSVTEDEADMVLG